MTKETRAVETVILYTSAPDVYDGFGTTTLEVIGIDRRGNPVRKVVVEKQHHGRQMARYDSGLCVYTNECMKLEDYVRFGDWKLNA